MKRLMFLFWGAMALGKVNTLPSHDFCFPGEPCFPTLAELTQFSNSLNGSLLYPISPGYSSAIINHNVYTTAFPELVVMVAEIEDVQKSVKFARKYNLKITVKSSGHDYNGRDTWDGSLMINLGNYNRMSGKNVSARAPMGEITVGSGATWLSVYEVLTDYNRVIVGGSAHTVSMGGYTLGGGHSPICRMFGMAVDNLLEVKLVTADGRIVIATEDSTRIQEENGHWADVADGELFWALRGGGGSTFGIATDFTFKVHQEAPDGMVRLSISYPFYKNNRNIGKLVLQKFNSIITNLPREWGGYLLLGAQQNADGSLGSVTFFMNHFGNIHAHTKNDMDEMYNFMVSDQFYRDYQRYDNFLEYEKTAIDANQTVAYIFNSLVVNFTDAFIDDVSEILFSYPLNRSIVGMTGTLIGGKMQEVADDATAVHPGFRQAYMSLSGGVSWGLNDLGLTDQMIEEGRKINERFRKLGYGMYRNEASPLAETWEDDYWGKNYVRLLRSKHKWDPTNVFTCFDCVNSSN